uniref:Uncharacterized protein n=1 Tax=Magallana gigas TaxID=29159 RepID=A0A8W8NJY7_MAGGI
MVKRTEDDNNIDIRTKFVQKRTVITPNTVICANVALYGPSINKGMHVVLEPLKTNKTFVMAATVIDPGNVAAVNIMNPRNGTIVIKPGKHIVNAVDLGEEFETAYSEGDLVYRLNEATTVGQSRKLQSPWKGPYLVISCDPPLYTIMDQKERQLTLVHDKLKMCNAIVDETFTEHLLFRR